MASPACSIIGGDLQERLHEEFRRAQRHGDGLSLLMLDLDHFKELNDRCGHQVGDRVLKQISKLIVASGARDRSLCPLRR